MSHSTTEQIVFITVGGAFILRPGGKKLYIKGGPDNNPTARVLKSINANLQALEAAAQIEDAHFRGQTEERLTQTLTAQVEHLVALQPRH